MATFGYEAIDRSGKTLKGSMEANTIELARGDLRKRGLTIIKLEEQSMLTKDIEFDFGGMPTTRDLSVLCRQFVSMTRAGVSILEAIKMLCEQTENKKLEKALTQVRVDVEKGEALATAFAAHPKIFPTIMINMVAAGEASGNLETAFERVSTQLERNNKTQAMIKKASIYPIVVCIVAIAVVIVMLVVVIPSYSAMFVDLGTDLPGITKAVVAASEFIQSWWYIIVPVLIGAGFLLKTYSATDSGKHVFGKLALSIPVVKNLTVKSASSMMARTLSTLMGAGVPLIEAIGIVADVMSNIWYKEALYNVKEQVMLGVPLSKPLEDSGLFPPMVYHMISIGEEAGSTEEMLDRLADYYDEEVEMAVQSLMAAMEPMIIIVLAGIVGIILGAVMAPMLTMYQALDNL